jgi:hypothetical protein
VSKQPLILLALIVVAIMGQWSDLLAAVSGVLHYPLHVLDVLRDYNDIIGFDYEEEM